MDVVVTHESADFDALASAVAASRLYPGATVLLGRALSAPVRDFLAVHKDRFPVSRPGEVDERRVRRLIVVDVRRASRLGAFPVLLERARARDAGLEVHLWDHHPSAPDDLRGTVRRVEAVGAVTTLLLEALREGGAEIDEMEATLFALGIYADTGSFTYATTTARDVRMGAFLLEQGASLATLNRYLNPPLSNEQRGALEATLREVRVTSVRGAQIGFAVLRMPRRCEGLDLVVTKALELTPLAAIFVIAVVGEKTTDVVARSRSRSVDVADALRALGGGGYASAGSARVKHAEGERVAAEIEAHLGQSTADARRVAEVMSAPVRTLAPDVSLGAAERLLTEWGVSGAPVVAGGALRGILSRRDIQKARRGDRLELPVASHMTQHVACVRPDTAVEEAFETVTRGDIGRLVVLDGEAIAGIVTRSDLLRVLYE